MPQYRIPQKAVGLALSAQADTHFSEGQSVAGSADKYLRRTVFLAAALFLVGMSIVQRLGLPGPARDSGPAALEP